MNENRTEITNQVSENILKKSLSVIGDVSNFVREKIEYLGINFSNTMSIILTFFIAFLFIFIATKISNKIAKFILIILGLILIIGISYSIIANLIL